MASTISVKKLNIPIFLNDLVVRFLNLTKGHLYFSTAISSSNADKIKCSLCVTLFICACLLDNILGWVSFAWVALHLRFELQTQFAIFMKIRDVHTVSLSRKCVSMKMRHIGIWSKCTSFETCKKYARTLQISRSTLQL